jgi:hypothetical protein
MELLNDEFSNEKAVIERFEDVNFQACLQADELFTKSFGAADFSDKNMDGINQLLRIRIEDNI